MTQTRSSLAIVADTIIGVMTFGLLIFLIVSASDTFSVIQETDRIVSESPNATMEEIFNASVSAIFAAAILAVQFIGVCILLAAVYIGARISSLKHSLAPEDDAEGFGTAIALDVMKHSRSRESD